MLNYIFHGKLRNALLFWFLGLALLPLLFMFSFFYTNVEKSLEQSAIRNLQTVSERQAQYINSWFAEKQQTIRTVAASSVIRTGDTGAIKNYFQQIKEVQPDFNTLNFINDKGINTFTTYDAIKGVDFSDRPYFKAGLEGQDYISDAMIGRGSGNPVVTISSPVKSNGKIVGLIVGSIKIDKITQVLTTSNWAAGGDNYLVNRDGVAITELRYTPQLRKKGAITAAANTSVLQYKVSTAGINRAFKEKLVAGRFQNYLGEPVYGAYRWLPDRNWILIVERNVNATIGQIIAKFQQTVVMGVVMVILMVIPIALILARKVTQPVSVLADMANGIAQGHLEQHVSINSYHELNILGQSFNIMANQIRQSRKILERQLKNLISQKEAIDEQNRQLLEVQEELQIKQSELEVKNTLLEKMAITDQLTQIYNRAYIMNRLPSEISHATRYDESISVIMLDIDYFKEINDRYGHQTGDRVLKQVAQVIKRTIRQADVPARFGGEEFIVICPNTDLTAAQILADRIRKNIARHGIRSKNELFYVTASLGVATLAGEDQTLEQKIDNFFHTADMAMYRAKKYGRNRVEIMD